MGHGACVREPRGGEATGRKSQQGTGTTREGWGRQQDLGGPTLLWGIQGGKAGTLPDLQKQQSGGVSYSMETLNSFLLLPQFDPHPRGSWKHLEIIQSSRWAV